MLLSFFQKTTKHLLVMALFFSASPAAFALQAVLTRNIFYAPDEKNTSLSPYVELYWQIDPGSLLFAKDKDELSKGTIKTDILITSNNAVVAEDHYILETLPLANVSDILNQRIMDIRRYALTGGSYSVSVTLTDQVKKGGAFKYTDTFSVPPIGSIPLFSDIQLIDTIIAAGGQEQNAFQRNNNLQFPLSTNFIDDNRKSVRFYAELYNTLHLPKEQRLITKIFVTKKASETTPGRLVVTDTVRPALLQIVAGKISTASLPSGNYYLHMHLETEKQSVLASRSIFFQLINTKPVAFVDNVPADTSKEKDNPVYFNLGKSFVAKYTAPQIRAILKMLLPIAQPPERTAIAEFLRKPDDMYSRYFIYNFWLSRNSFDPEQEWVRYSERVKEVNKLFGSSLIPGYESERGIFYLKYGEPTDRIIVPNESGSVPYEIWQYNVMEKQTNGMFLFYKTGITSNDFRLLHSNVNGELQNRSWRNLLYINSSNADHSNSRAEQYFGNR